MDVLPQSVTDLLPQTDIVVLAVVSGITLDSPGGDLPEILAHAQSVELVVVKVMRGSAMVQVGQKLLVENPAGQEPLRLGHKGLFLLKYQDKGGAPRVLGRFMPASWPLSRMEDAFGASS